MLLRTKEEITGKMPPYVVLWNGAIAKAAQTLEQRKAPPLLHVIARSAEPACYAWAQGRIFTARQLATACKVSA